MTEPASNTTWWESLAKWSAAAFIVAGVARLANMLLANLDWFMAMTSPEWTRDMTLLIAFVGAYLGLFGLYPRVADDAPRLSRISVILAAVAGVSIIISIVAKYVHGAEQPPGPLAILLLFYLLLSPLSFLLFGVASLRTDSPSRTVGLLLLAVVAAFAFLVAGIFSQVEVLFALDALVFAGATLGLGYVLRAETEPTDRAEPAPTEARHD